MGVRTLQPPLASPSRALAVGKSVMKHWDVLKHPVLHCKLLHIMQSGSQS